MPARTDARVVRPGEVVAVLGGSALLASSWLIVALERRVPDWEVRLLRDTNDLADGLWPVVRVPMQLGGFAGSLGVVGVAWLVSRNRRLTLAALVASQVAYWTSKGLKSVVSRGRPGDLLVGVNVREHATGLGYVSGHSAVAFALAAVLGPSLRRRWQQVGAGLLAVLIGFARVYGGVHLPLDVVGGAGLGLLAGTLARWLFGLGGEGLAATD